MRKFDLSLRSSRSSYFATFRHQLTILSKTDELDEEKWLNMLGTFVFNDSTSTEIYALALHDALPISRRGPRVSARSGSRETSRSSPGAFPGKLQAKTGWSPRSEEHTSELQSLAYLVCRLLLEKKKEHSHAVTDHLTLVRHRRPVHRPP